MPCTGYLSLQHSCGLGAMPPKKAKAKAAPPPPGQPEAVAPAAPGHTSATEIELRPGEKDNANLSYIERLNTALTNIMDHPVFAGIQSADSLGINQAPFDTRSYEDALKNACSYTCGINLFWLDFMWSATPGVPLRASAIEHMSKTLFKEPTRMDGVHIAVTGPEFRPLEHKGALKRVSPEEVTGAIVLAIARDIKNSEPDAVLQRWRQCVLCTSATFKVPTAPDRYWYALQMRETHSTMHLAVHRSTFQRLHEISRLMRRLRESTPAAEVTSAMIAKAYAENLKMAPGSAAAVTLNFVDCCATITNKLLDNTDTAWCLQDLDERSALTGDPNPFDSHSRLQAIIDKCRANNTVQLSWVVQGIWCHWRRGNVKFLSITDIKGSPQTGNRGLADLLLFKQQLKSVFLAKAASMFPESADWFSITVSSTAESFKSWSDAEDSSDKAWRAGRPPAEVKCLAFFADLVFGKAYDAPLKMAVKASKTPADALQTPGLVEYLQEIDAKRALDRGSENTTEVTADPEELDKPAGESDEIIFHLPAKDSAKASTVVKASDVTGPKREMLDSIISNTRQNIAAHIHLIPQEPDEPHPHGLVAALMATPLGKLRGAPNPKDPAKSKYIGIFYDPKVAGEANHRPQLRVPPLRSEPLRRLVELARSRVGPTEVTDEELPEGDIYFLFDGGKFGNQGELLKPFAGKPKSVKSLLLWRDEDSYHARYQRVRGVGSCQLQEGLHFVTAGLLAVRPVKFQTYRGTTAGTMMGPIIMPDSGTLWAASWPQKKDIYTPANLIPVGGRLDDDDDAEPASRAKARDKDTVEPVFYHALPESFYAELLAAFPLAGVLDLTPGDGALALSAYKKGLVYVGLTFGTAHQTLLAKHLEKSIWKAMSTDHDPLYEPRLVTALREDQEPASAKAQGAAGVRKAAGSASKAQTASGAAKAAGAPPRAKGPAAAPGAPQKAVSKKRAHDPEDPVDDDLDDADDNDDDHLSGDDAS